MTKQKKILLKYLLKQWKKQRYSIKESKIDLRKINPKDYPQYFDQNLKKGLKRIFQLAPYKVQLQDGKIYVEIAPNQTKIEKLQQILEYLYGYSRIVKYYQGAGSRSKNAYGIIYLKKSR